MTKHSGHSGTSFIPSVFSFKDQSWILYWSNRKKLIKKVLLFSFTACLMCFSSLLIAQELPLNDKEPLEKGNEKFGAFWKINGNNMTIPKYQFIGTIDYKDFVFKTNSIEAMRLTKDGDLLLANSLFIEHNLDVGNDAHIGRDLDVDRNANVDFDVHIGQDLDVDHNANIDNDVHIGQDLDVDRNANVDFDVVIGRDLTVGRNTKINQNLMVANDTYIGNDLDVVNDASVNNDLTVAGILRVTNLSNAVNPSTGALRVSGGAGIGEDLEVGNDGRFQNDLTVDNDGSFGGNLSVSDIGARQVNVNTGASGNNITSSGEDLFLRTTNSDNLIINSQPSDGKVAIGTVNIPNSVMGTDVSGYKLFVQGGILTEEVRVRTDWADFVFAPQYNLRPLNEVKNYISDNGHLPDTPSAEEIQNQGLELAANATNQQVKIEELFLYLIQLDEKVTALEEENANLKTLLNQKQQK